MTRSFGAVRDRADDSRAETPGRQVFAAINLMQQTQHLALPHQRRALVNAVWECTLDLPYDEIKALSDHSGKGQQVPVIVSTNYRRLVERTAE